MFFGSEGFQWHLGPAFLQASVKTVVTQQSLNYRKQRHSSQQIAFVMAEAADVLSAKAQWIAFIRWKWEVGIFQCWFDTLPQKARVNVLSGLWIYQGHDKQNSFIFQLSQISKSINQKPNTQKFKPLFPYLHSLEKLRFHLRR